MPSEPEPWGNTDSGSSAQRALAALPREARLLLLAGAGPEADAVLRDLVGQEIDWNALAALAIREQALPILGKRLSGLGAGALPPASAPLVRLGIVVEFQLLRLQRRLYDTVAALAHAGIEPVLLKGAAVAHTAYPHFALRPMSDIDLLVRPEQAAPSLEVLQNAGWAPSRYAHPAKAYEEHQHLPPLDDEGGGTGAGLDLHTDLFGRGHPFRFSALDVHRCARRLTREGNASLLVPDPVHQLLHACVHFAWANMLTRSGWRTFRDIAALARLPDVEWGRFIDLAHRSRAATCCYWTLWLAGSTMGCPVPIDVMGKLRPRLGHRTQSVLERHFIFGLLPTAHLCRSKLLRNALWRAGMLPGRSGHGAARPWHQRRRWRPTSASELRKAVTGYAVHFGSSVGTPRYLWSVIRQ